MKLALAQLTPTDGRIRDTFDKVARLARGMAELGAGMLVLPELLLPGYNRPDLHRDSPAREGWTERMQEIAAASGVGLTFGWAERADDGLFNSAMAIGADGAVLARYRKIQLFGPMESSVFTPGTEAPPIFDLLGEKAGLLICYDIEFPQHAAALAARGARIILVPTANPAGFDLVPRTLVPARAYENRLTVAYANYCGTEAGLEFGGHSVIVGPDGAPLAQAGRSETVLVVDLPPRDSWPEATLSNQARDYRRL